MKKVLIVGSKGMAGHIIRQVIIDSNEFEVLDIARTENKFTPTYLMDVSEINSLREILEAEKPDIVINCIGILNQDAESNPEKAIYFNSFLPHYLAAHCTRLIHISTDCVFSGSKGSYVESDLKDGSGFYAQSKAIGEVTYGSHLTVRTSIVGPELKTNGIGLFHWFMSQRGSIKGYTGAYWSGVTTLQLAKSILEILNVDNLTGLLHLTNNHKINKLDLLRLFESHFHKGVEIIPFDGYNVDKSFINTRGDVSISVPSYDQMVTELKAWINSKAALYDQYF